MKQWIKEFINKRANSSDCPFAIKWAEDYDTAQDAWKNCQRVDWMLSYIKEGDFSPDQLKALISLSTKFTKFVLPSINDTLINKCVENIQGWALGKVPIEKVGESASLMGRKDSFENYESTVYLGPSSGRISAAKYADQVAVSYLVRGAEFLDKYADKLSSSELTLQVVSAVLYATKSSVNAIRALTKEENKRFYDRDVPERNNISSQFAVILRSGFPKI